jgi:dTDP-glucose pyrophosphorylase
MEQSQLVGLCIAADATVRDVIECVDRGHCEIALVVASDRMLVATVTDGDIRRALLRGVGLDAGVRGVMKEHPVTAPAGTPVDLLLGLMVDKRIRHVPLVDPQGRLVDLALLTDLATPRALPNTAVVMAGGEGVRMRPLTDQTPKPMLHVGDRPILETIVRRLAAEGFRQIAISTRYRREQIEDHFVNGLLSVDVEFLREDERLGTIGGVRQLLARLREPVLVMNGDILTQVPFRSLLAFHEAEHATMTACVREHAVQLPFGVVELTGGHVRQILEKPTRTFYINAGIYVLDPSAVAAIPERRRCDATDLIALLLESGERVAAFPVREYWRDIGGPEDYLLAQAEYDLLFRPTE